MLSFFIINKPSDVGQYQDGVDPAEEKTEEKNTADKDGRKMTVYKNACIENHYTYAAALHTPLFWGLVLLHTLTLCLSNYIMNPGSLLFVQAGFTMETVSTVLSARQLIRLAFLAFLMRYMDRIEPVKLITFTCGLAAVCYAISANPTSYWQILAFYAGGSIVMSAQMAIPGVMLANIYGTTSFGKIYGTYLLVSSLISSLSSTISGTIAQRTGSYAAANHVWAVAGGAAVLTGILCMRLLKKERMG